ncbi:MAG: undecaprenyl/decaprenyl-phosphate alpha-N-acetylglucosaminyl 1-phosphate transferase [bacterium]|nr:MAG: undecaprenyl/decaprenyl-phosphate alpha-N-acetylglucosaminyl 1-phosphate transferase [bacterium]
MEWSYLSFPMTFVVALGVSLALTPWMARTARGIGMVDRPDGGLKRHGEPVAYMGGLAVFVAFLIGFSPFHQLDRQVLAILLGGTLVVLLGFLDDLGNLRPATKLLGQTLAVLVVMKAGIAIKIVFLPPWLAYPLSFLWLLGMTNAFNIIDIMDGLSSGVGSVACLFLFIVALSAGQVSVAHMTLALMGALMGFLRHNFQPARIYLGDAGSLFIGFMLGALSMVGVYARNNPVAVLAPVLILGVPIFDTLFVMAVRWMRGQSPLRGSPDHFALRLRKWRLSVAGTVLLSYAVSFLLGSAGLAMVFAGQSLALAVLFSVSVLLLLSALWLRKIDMNL